MICVLISDNMEYLLGLCYILGTVPYKCFCELTHFTYISMNSVLTIHILGTRSNLDSSHRATSWQSARFAPKLV